MMSCPGSLKGLQGPDPARLGPGRSAKQFVRHLNGLSPTLRSGSPSKFAAVGGKRATRREPPEGMAFPGALFEMQRTRRCPRFHNRVFWITSNARQFTPSRRLRGEAERIVITLFSFLKRIANRCSFLLPAEARPNTR